MEDKLIDDRLLGWDEVKHLTGKSRSTILRYMDVGAFPKRVTDSSGHILGWRLSDVMFWMDSLVEHI